MLTKITKDFWIDFNNVIAVHSDHERNIIVCRKESENSDYRTLSLTNEEFASFKKALENWNIDTCKEKLNKKCESKCDCLEIVNKIIENHKLQYHHILHHDYDAPSARELGI